MNVSAESGLSEHNENSVRIRTERICLAAAAVLAILRVIYSVRLGIHFESRFITDDSLMIEYARLHHHFLEPNFYSLVKVMSFPLFLDLISVLHVPYPAALGILVSVAAFSAYLLVRRLSGKPAFALFVYTWFLFHPVTFDTSVGTKLYRNAVLAPFTLLLFCAMAGFFADLADRNRSMRRLLTESILFSVLFLYVYYLKEDGLWYLACLAFFAAVLCLVFLIRAVREKKHPGREAVRKVIFRAVCLFLPFAVLAAGTAVYKEINRHYFGVAEVQTRTDGELGEFVSLIYQIDSPDQDYQYTAPEDSLEKAFEVSPTLGAHPEILENMRHSLWQGYDLKANPIFGDFLTWVLRSSLVETGQWQSEKQVSDMFHQVNGELRAAFASGRLKKNHKIYLLHSAAGRTPEEIGMLFPCVAFNFRQMTDLSFMSADLRNAGETTLEDRCEQAAALTGVDYLTDYSEREAEPLEKAVNFGNALIRVYRVINVIFACLAAASFLLMLVRVIRKKVSGSRGTYAAILFFAFMMLAIAFAYSFAVNWFSQFLWGTEMTKGAIWQLYYTSSLVSLLGLSMASAVSCLLRDL